MRRASSVRPGSALSVIHDGEYVEKSKKEFIEARRNREKWIGGDFRTIFGSTKKKIEP